ncbi:MAG TPA: efflux RND transporter periplasmic adaptor subunit [Opitutaceae bacterium]|nr:efflux RND transporter periplasmic adaptor subunit [Opitutaceae bacterium]HRE08327.1 efflux RND transporter periplasmic adaptor subunit [Opitutaceae bacterium]
MKSTLLSLLAVVLVAGCARPEHAASTQASLPPVRVRLAPVVVEQLPLLTDVTGTVRPVRRAVLAARVMGAISDRPVTLGRRVAAQDLLVKIVSEDAAARVTQARAQLNAARRDLDRETELLAKGASTAETVRNLQDRFTGSEAQLREAEIQLGFTEIRAPFDGVVSRTWVNTGDLAAPGQPLVEVEGIGDFEIEASVPESLAAALTPNAPLACDVAGTRFSAVLREVSSAADAATRSIGVKLAVPAGVAVRSGQFVRIQIPGSPVRVVLIPTEALSPRGQMERVFVAGEGNLAVLRLVRTGGVRGARTEVLSGLDEGERVVLAPPASLQEGQSLEVQP